MSLRSKQTIYLETSVISAYFDFWGKSQKQKETTREFWLKILSKYKSKISSVVVTELEEAKPEWKKQYSKLIQDIEILQLSIPDIKLAEKYIRSNIIPKSKRDDAIHLSIATNNKIDFFVTWNMKHFLRPFKLKQIVDFNHKNNLHLPILIKPIDFLE